MTTIAIRVLPTLAALGVLIAAASATPAHAKLKCKDVHGRWQICGDAKPFKSFTIGVGIHFSEKKPGLAANTAPTQPTAPIAPRRSFRR